MLHHNLCPRSSCQAHSSALRGARSLQHLFLSLLWGLSIRWGRSQSPAELGRRGGLPAALTDLQHTPCTGRAPREGRLPAAPRRFPAPRMDPWHGPTGAPQEGAHERHRASIPTARPSLTSGPDQREGRTKTTQKSFKPRLPSPPSWKMGQHTCVSIAGPAVLAPSLPLGHRNRFPTKPWLRWETFIGMRNQH